MQLYIAPIHSKCCLNEIPSLHLATSISFPIIRQVHSTAIKTTIISEIYV